MKLGSLFDGSGGFPLAGIMNGMTPAWASEIEPYPLRVTAARLPSMKQLGDVTKINGAAVEPVDVITFGSPCQDLSVAGKQKGIHDGERSSLFFEAIRIIKEMRDATADKFPRWAVWENVPGAFSSGKGEDFKAVLEALGGVCEDGLSIPRPKKWNHAGCVVGHGWSIACRLYDAQYWGVPQRRKRIYLIADFGSERAGEILFERESVRGDTAPGREAREGAAADAERGVGGSGGVKCLKIGLREFCRRIWHLKSERRRRWERFRNAGLLRRPRERRRANRADADRGSPEPGDGLHGFVHVFLPTAYRAIHAGLRIKYADGKRL